MPYLALTEHGTEKTAFDCRDEFRRDGTRYTTFSCPFCEVGYFAKRIYGEDDEDVGKAPHFSLFPKKPHIGDCNGEPIALEEPKKKDKDVAKRVEKREYEIPEKFVQKKEQRLVLGTPGTSSVAPNGDEIRRRREVFGLIYGNARYTSSLLQTFVKAKNFLVKQAFKEAKEKALTDKDRSRLISDITASYPLELFGQILNYNSAFWSANTVKNGASECIFHAKNGAVRIRSNGFEIVSLAPPGVLNKVTAIVRYDGTADELPKSHQRLFEILRSAANAARHVKWHAYGHMSLDASSGLYTLPLINLDYLFVEFA